MFRDTPHYLKPLKTTSVPKRLAFMDIRSKVTYRGECTELSWECGALGTTYWTQKDKVRKDTLKVFESPVDMWQVLDTFCQQGKRVVLWCFDLPEQARTSQALLHLPKLGWHLDTVVLEPGASWMLFKDGRRSLMFCDLKSWTPYDWERVKNAAMGGRSVSDMGRLGGDRGRAMAFNRCQIVREAVRQILEWIESEGLGVFRPTGSGQSYSAYRRKFHRDRILVHDDVLRLSLERQSMWSGRTEAWRHGRIDGGPFLELDMKAAYTRIASECNVPTVALGQVRNPDVKTLLNRRKNYAFLCQVEVNTETPVVPASSSTHTFWPIGDFTTWVWDPELTLLNRYATTVRVRCAYKYRTAPALQGFASYVLNTLDRPAGDKVGLHSLVLKHWSRTLVGRFGLRYRTWVPFSDDGDMDLSMVTFIDADENSMTDLLCVGHDMLLLGDLTESVESVPQIPAWIMSECRRRLWETMVEIGLDRIVYVDTDSIIVDTRGDRQYEQRLIRNYRGMWAPKARHAKIHIYGPRNLRTDSDRRMSGLPLDAEQHGPTEYRGRVMRSVKESMRSGHLGTVTHVPRTFKFTATDIRRGHNKDGSTFAFRLNNRKDPEER